MIFQNGKNLQLDIIMLLRFLKIFISFSGNIVEKLTSLIKIFIPLSTNMLVNNMKLLSKTTELY